MATSTARLPVSQYPSSRPAALSSTEPGVEEASPCGELVPARPLRSDPCAGFSFGATASPAVTGSVSPDRTGAEERRKPRFRTTRPSRRAAARSIASRRLCSAAVPRRRTGFLAAAHRAVAFAAPRPDSARKTAPAHGVGRGAPIPPWAAAHARATVRPCSAARTALSRPEADEVNREVCSFTWRWCRRRGPRWRCRPARGPLGR